MCLPFGRMDGVKELQCILSFLQGSKSRSTKGEKIPVNKSCWPVRLTFFLSAVSRIFFGSGVGGAVDLNGDTAQTTQTICRLHRQ